MFLIGAIIAIAATFGALALMFSSFGFISKKVYEEDLLGATVNYIEALNRKLGIYVANDVFTEQDFRPTSICGNGCQEMSCDAIGSVITSKGKTWDIDCKDPLGRTWALRKLQDGNNVFYYIAFTPVPRDTLLRLGYNIQDQQSENQVQKSIALRISSKLGKGGYLENFRNVSLPGEPNVKDIITLASTENALNPANPISWNNPSGAANLSSCPKDRLPYCPVGSVFNLMAGYCEASYLHPGLTVYEDNMLGHAYKNSRGSFNGYDRSYFLWPFCPSGMHYNPASRCCERG